MTKRAVVVCSGGLDSTTLAYHYKNEGYSLFLLGFNYGQRHSKELRYMAKTAHQLEADFAVVDLFHFGDLLESALTQPEIDVPEGHYESDTMKATVVPNRNSIMLNMAVGVAISQGADLVATGVHAGDHAVYPDCRPEFIDLLNDLVQVANEGFVKDSFVVEAPFVYKTKTDIAKLAGRLHVPIEDTWSCYKGQEIHCGRCSTCIERREALHYADVPDWTVYADNVYWKEVTGV